MIFESEKDVVPLVILFEKLLRHFRALFSKAFCVDKAGGLDRVDDKCVCL